MKPMKQCNHAGCRKLIPFDTAYCDKHRQDSKRKPHDAIDSKAESIRVHHSYKWRKISERYRLKNPVCEQCLKDVRDPNSGNFEGIPRFSTSVDHIKPLFLGGDPYNEDNLQALCEVCHNKKSLEERREKK
ncbi:HNH endonuclease [Liquorilactobacillus sucicola]|uniref:HNH endonuclease n=1 Tax=Liquorilactobacillus sucicola TaxID=519050 RepID=UPI0007055237|nr:HNH endonuclease signature motif containing protein [Liquorilactobacillus sucicola]